MIIEDVGNNTYTSAGGALVYVLLQETYSNVLEMLCKTSLPRDRESLKQNY